MTPTKHEMLLAIEFFRNEIKMTKNLAGMRLRKIFLIGHQCDLSKSKDTETYVKSYEMLSEIYDCVTYDCVCTCSRKRKTNF